MPDVTFVAAVDLVPQRAADAAAASGGEALTDYRALFGRVDAVVVAVPTVDHLSVAREFLERGVHVLVEKPMAASLAEADALIAVADRSGAPAGGGPHRAVQPRDCRRDADSGDAALHRGPSAQRISRAQPGYRCGVRRDDSRSGHRPCRRPVGSARGGCDRRSRPDVAESTSPTRESGSRPDASRTSRPAASAATRFERSDSFSRTCTSPSTIRPRSSRSGGCAGRGDERPAIEGGRVEVRQEEPLARELADFVSAIRDGRDAARHGSRRPARTRAGDEGGGRHHDRHDRHERVAGDRLVLDYHE